MRTCRVFAQTVTYKLYVAIVIEIEKLIYSNRTVNALGPVRILMAVTRSEANMPA